MATCRVTGQESAEAIVGAGRCRQRTGKWKQAGKEPGSLTPPKGQTQNRKGAPMSFHDTTNPSGEVPLKRAPDRPIPEHHLLKRILSRQNME